MYALHFVFSRDRHTDILQAQERRAASPASGNPNPVDNSDAYFNYYVRGLQFLASITRYTDQMGAGTSAQGGCTSVWQPQSR